MKKSEKSAGLQKEVLVDYYREKKVILKAARVLQGKSFNLKQLRTILVYLIASFRKKSYSLKTTFFYLK